MQTFKLNENASTDNYQQTDWGGIYHNIPSEYSEPSTVEELALLLKHYNRLNKRVTIRNTGHSVNGQTLTDGVQVSLKRLKHVEFNKEKMIVSCYAGNTWDEVFQGIEFPKYSLEVFPNNPGQKIQIGGTAAVGGIGFYTTTAGGLWNHITEIKLVTMKGEIITCNYKDNFEYLQYGLSGFGRIGVIAEMKIKVVDSFKFLCVPILTSYKSESFYKEIDKAYKTGYYDGIAGVRTFSDKKMRLSKAFPHYAAFLMKELKNGLTKEDVFDFTHRNFPGLLDISMVEEKIPKHIYDLDIEIGRAKIPKRDIVYGYPLPVDEDQQHGLHPWSDYILGKSIFPQFIEMVLKVLKKYQLEEYQIKEGFFDSIINLPNMCIYTGKVMSHEDNPFPLSPGYRIEDDYMMGLGLNCTVPFHKLEDSIKAVNELTNLVYEIGGVRYLYGLHNLSAKQIYQHYGSETIKRWNEIKAELDPKNLLNIGVLPHLDQ